MIRSRKGLLRAQQLVARKGDGSCNAGFLSHFNLNTTQRQHETTRCPSSSWGPTAAFLTAIPGGRMMRDIDMLVVSGIA